MRKAIIAMLMALVALPALASPPDTAIKKARTYNNTWIKPGTAMMLSKTQHWTMDSLVLDALDTVNAGGGSSSGLSSASWAESWKFTRDYTYYYKLVTDTLSITPDTSNNVLGGAVYAEIVADGVSPVSFDTAFTVVSGAYVNDAGQVNIIIGFRNATGYTLSITQSKVVAVPDVTPPTVVSAAATDAHTIHIVFSEAVTGTTAGYSFSNGSGLTISSRTGSGSSAWDFTVSDTLTYLSVITRSYNSGTGNSVDGSSNPLATYTTQSVTNSITGVSDITFTGSDVSTVAGATGTSSTNASFGHLGIGNLSLPASTDGYIQAKFVTGHGDVVLHLSTSSTALGYSNSANKIGIDLDGTTGDVYVLESGTFSNGATPVGVLANGNIIAIFRVGSGFVIKKSTDNGATFPTTLFTPSVTSTAHLYPAVDCKGAATAIIDLVKAFAFL